MFLAYLILALHVVIIVFNVAGLIAIPIGAVRGWAFVRAPLWRILHLASLGIVAAQAIAGRACFLTIWQDEAAGTVGASEPLIMKWANAVLFWPLPMWAFSAIYVAIFIYVLALLWWIPPRWSARKSGSSTG